MIDIQRPEINVLTTHIWPIGTKYLTRGKAARLCTVVDVLRTFDSNNRLIEIRYVSMHEFLGQTVLNYDVCATTVAMGNYLLRMCE